MKSRALYEIIALWRLSNVQAIEALVSLATATAPGSLSLKAFCLIIQKASSDFQSVTFSPSANQQNVVFQECDAVPPTPLSSMRTRLHAVLSLGILNSLLCCLVRLKTAKLQSLRRKENCLCFHGRDIFLHQVWSVDFHPTKAWPLRMGHCWSGK